MNDRKLRRRERTAIIKALQSGVVPRIGLQHLQVGRTAEVDAVLDDLEHIADGGAAVRLVLGPFGSGKTFFLNLARTVAHSKDFVVAHADVHTQRRLYSSQGQARALYAELMHNLTTKASPQQGALPALVEGWVGNIRFQVRKENGDDADVTDRIFSSLESLKTMVNGYDFASVLAKYYEGYASGDDELQEAALRWLRAEYTTKVEARQALGVRNIIDDATIYEHLKLMGAFVRLAGYSGLIVSLDEMGVLTQRISHPKSREGNFEVVLQILNDCLQGTAVGIGFLMSGVPEFVDDPRRGLNSYGALKTRLAENRFARELNDNTGPVLRLDNLSPEDLYVLLSNIREVFANQDEANYLVSDDGLLAFMNHCQQHIGAEYFRTPRDSVKDFVGLLSVLEQNSNTDWRDLLEQKAEAVAQAEEKALGVVAAGVGDERDELQSFKL